MQLPRRISFSSANSAGDNEENAPSTSWRGVSDAFSPRLSALWVTVGAAPDRSMYQHACMANELWRKSAGELAALVRAGEVSSVEVVQSHLERIAEVNGSIGAAGARRSGS